MNCEEKIREAILFAKKDGFRITHDVWGIRYNYRTKHWTTKNGECCPLGALIIRFMSGKIPYTMTFEQVSANILKVNEDWIDNFIRGWDQYSNIDVDHEASKLAEKLIKEFGDNI